jgi:hypothetical protein
MYISTLNAKVHKFLGQGGKLNVLKEDILFA